MECLKSIPVDKCCLVVQMPTVEEMKREVADITCEMQSVYIDNTAIGSSPRPSTTTTSSSEAVSSTTATTTATQNTSVTTVNNTLKNNSTTEINLIHSNLDGKSPINSKVNHFILMNNE
ncbi:unnamed protein product [Schistosoma turkestanicum]|nr:unnamed protein product [Schistosoma turkestanicum]